MSPTRRPRSPAHCPLAASYAGDLAAFFTGLTSPAAGRAGRPGSAWEADWLPELSTAAAAARWPPTARC